MPPSPLRFATRAVQAGSAPDPATGAHATPIVLSNGFVFDDLDHGSDIFALKRAGFAYSRGSNPTNAALERRVADLEGGSVAIACGSGQGALLMILTTLCRTGEEYVAASRVFGGSIGLMKRMESQFGIVPRYVDPLDLEALARAVTPATKAILIESIVNPSGEIVDVPAIAAIARAANVPLVVDNTLATPALLRPIEHGADIVWHSASKFFCGNGTVIGGVIVDAGRFDWRGDRRFPLISEPWEDYDGIELATAQPTTAFATACRLVGLRELGPGLSPMNAFMILTGIETLPLRMARHSANALAVAGHLGGHRAVEHVSYPGLPSHPQHNLGRALCPDGLGSVFTMTLHGGEPAARIVLDRLKLFSHLVNIGETRSLIAHPVSTTHRNAPADLRAMLGILPGTLRLSIGLEDPEDLVADLDQALAAA